MKTLKYLILFLIIGLGSCSEDALNPVSNFQDPTTQPNEFDSWIQKIYTEPYNMRLNYRYVDIESDLEYNLLPADRSKSLALAKLIKYLWIDSYDEVNKDNNPNFMKIYGPKIIQLIGSAAWNDDGSRILGQAEGGLKITLYEVNAIDVDHIDINQMNDLFFHTMHHEFCHILHQTKDYSPDFKLITNEDYNSSGWKNIKEPEALRLGFITNYGSSEPNEDFVETASLYMVQDDAWWAAKLAIAKEEQVSKTAFDSYVGKGVKTIKTVTNTDGSTAQQYYIVYNGDQKILQKLGIVKDYFQSVWNFSIDDLREIIHRRSGTINTLDLKSYN